MPPGCSEVATTQSLSANETHYFTISPSDHAAGMQRAAAFPNSAISL